ncbi:hypothetical protein [Micromonospora echinospora]|uniref:hypothetical protein n=1 Tax=Micromonospora echinospora TaxID=1877 RepID=UPI00366C0463
MFGFLDPNGGRQVHHPGAAPTGAVNVLPIAALWLGAAILALGRFPRAVSKPNHEVGWRIHHGHGDVVASQQALAAMSPANPPLITITLVLPAMS